MSLRDVMEFIQKQHGAVTPVTPENSMGLQPQPAWIGRVPPVTPVTPALCNVRAYAQEKPPSEAANDPGACEPTDWRALDAAYLAHHAHCPVCIAAGRGARYGLRCGVGASLWSAYSAAVSRPGALPWQQARGRG